MASKKAEDQQEIFNYPVRTRVTEKVFKRLEKLRETNNCSTIGGAGTKGFI